MINFLGELLDLTLQADYIYIALLWLMVFVVVIVWQPHNFVRKS